MRAAYLFIAVKARHSATALPRSVGVTTSLGSVCVEALKEK